MKYIGSFFRMNSLSKDDIRNQLFFLAKESVRTITQTSKCGIYLPPNKSSKKSNHNHDINILEDFFPLLCIYKSSSPTLVHSKNTKSFDESTFKKEIIPFNNALMSLSLLELSKFYEGYDKKNRSEASLKSKYIALSKKQLDFYCANLRNSEGFFVNKNNTVDSNLKNYNLIPSNKKVRFSDQAFMMIAYYLYSKSAEDDLSKDDYENFSLEILSMFGNYKEELYELSFDESVKILFAFNIFYSYSMNDTCKELIIDLCDFLISKFNDKNYYESSIDDTSLFAICLKDSYEYTQLISFKDKSDEIILRLEDLYNEKTNIFHKSSTKKEIKYSCLEVSFYLMALLLKYPKDENVSSNKNMIFSLYKKSFIHSGLVLSWPEAPTLDEIERYRGLSLHSEDMLNENHFRFRDVPSPNSSGVASIFNRSVTYSSKKDTFNHSKESFDSGKNMFIFFTFIHYFKDDVIRSMNLFSDDTLDNIDLNKLSNSSPSVDLTSEKASVDTNNN